MENSKQIKEGLNLTKLQNLQTKFPTSHVGGSVGLFLHGAELKRWGTNPSDFDIVIPYYIPLADDEKQEDLIEDHTSGNDFDYMFFFEDTKVDCKIDPTQTYTVIEFDGFKYKVTSLDTILKAKIKYALNNRAKHINDITELIENKFLTPGKYLNLVKNATLNNKIIQNNSK